MHVEFKKVILHNFMSFGHAELEFNNEGFIRVSGINENPHDNAQSNGSGKSSLWEAIIWGITGDTIRGTKQVVNLYGDDGCYVDLEFTLDSTHYRIIRSKEHKVWKTNLQIYIDGEDRSGKGIRDSDKLLQQYLPDLTASLLGSVIILGQGLPQKFTNNSPSGRKEVLEKLSKSDFMIEDLKARVSSRKTMLLQEVRVFEDALLECNAKKLFLNNQIVQSEHTLRELDKDTLTTELKNEELELARVKNELSEFNVSLNALDSQLTTSKSEESSILLEQSSELNDAKFNYEQCIHSHQQEYNHLVAQLDVYNKELTRIRNIRDICPTCGQKITSVHKPDTSELEVNIATTQAELNVVKEFLTQAKNEYELDIARIQEKYRSKKLSAAATTSSLQTELNHIRSAIRTNEDCLSKTTEKINSITKQLTQLQSMIEFNQKIIADNQEQLKIIEEKILYNNMQKDLSQSHVEVVSKFDTALKRDFRGYLLSTVISYIETRAKQYCKVIFDTTNIGFCLDGNNIDISYMNKAYENLSSGEKQKVDLIIQFSIRDMLSSQLNFTSNILVLDEVFDGLDSIGCTRVIDLISDLSDVKNVFIVTHRKDLSLPSDKELIVVKSSAGISEMRQ